MTTRKNTLERSRLAKGMRLSGLPLAAVAERLDCSVRTARRYSRMDLSEDFEDDFDVPGANAEERQLFLKKGWPLLLSMVDTLETRVEADSISTRDLTTAISVLSDRLTKFSPRESFTETTETQVVFNLVLDDAPEKAFIDAPENERALESDSEALEDNEEG